jgi:hypothetical protein
MNWCWNYVTFQRGTRLITGISGSRIEDVMPAVMTAPPIPNTGVPVGGQASAIQSDLHHQHTYKMRDPAHSDRIDRERAIPHGPFAATVSCSLEPLNDVKTISGSSRRGVSALSRYGCIAE